MRFSIALTGVLLAISGAALAQPVETRCRDDGNGNLVCTSDPGSNRDPYEEGFRQASDAMQAVVERYERQSAEQSYAKLRQQVGKALAAGNCDEARKIALVAGNFDLAERAQALCRPGSEPTH